MFPTPPLVFQNQLSGNLLRKFKNSNGWQKLWVVFTNFCLFFYKSHQVSAHEQLALTWRLPAPAERSACMKHTQMSGSGGFQPATSIEIFGSKTVTLVCLDGLYALPYSRCSEGGGVLNTRLGVPLGVLEFNSRHKQGRRTDPSVGTQGKRQYQGLGRARYQPHSFWENGGQPLAGRAGAFSQRAREPKALVGNLKVY